jgi:hypothetical protein
MKSNLKPLAYVAIFLVAGFSVQCNGYSGDKYSYHSREFDATPTRVLTRESFIGSVFFKTGSAIMSKAAQIDLGHMALRMQQSRYAGKRVVIVGHADRKRGVDENADLANERAQKVAIMLEKQGLELGRLVLDSRQLPDTRGKISERRVDLYFSAGDSQPMSNLYPILVAFFLLTAGVVALVVFRRR